MLSLLKRCFKKKSYSLLSNPQPVLSFVEGWKSSLSFPKFEQWLSVRYVQRPVRWLTARHLLCRRSAARVVSAVKLSVTFINAGNSRAHWAKRRLYRTKVPAWLSGQVPARLGANTSMEEDKKSSGQYESGPREWRQLEVSAFMSNIHSSFSTMTCRFFENNI